MNATLPLFVLHIQSTDEALFRDQVRARVGQAPEFFQATPVVISMAALSETDYVPDWAALCSFLREMGMRPAGIMDASDAQRDSALAYGLAQFPDRVSRVRPTLDAPDKPEVGAGGTAIESEVTPPNEAGAVGAQTQLPLESAGTKSIAVAAPATPAASASARGSTQGPAQVSERRPALLIDKPVRTGQRIHAQGTDLIVLAVVSAGAELISDGDIHVYAPLRGRALAGARGNTAARIFSQSMEAELVSIAGNFKILEDVPAHLKGKPTQVFLEQSGVQPRVVMQPLGAVRTSSVSGTP